MISTNIFLAAVLVAITVNTARASALPDDIFQNGFETQTPFTATAKTWTWTPIDGAMCGNGTATGIGVNLNPSSNRVLIYLEGGGACWSDLTCFTLMSAAHFTNGYGESDFTTESTDTSDLAQPGGFFDRTAAANPFKDYNYIYVPYCTGDEHAGDNIIQYSMTDTGYHVGFSNMRIYLNRIVGTFPNADRVFLAGSDVGGFGAAFNWWQTQQRFGNVRVDLIDDSGTFMPPDIVPSNDPTQQAQRTEWNLAATLPSGCTGCATSLDVIFGYYASVFPNNRGALMSYSPDSVLPSYYGINSSQFSTGLNELVADQFTPNPNLHSFVVGSTGHILWFDPTLMSGTTTVQQWLTQMTTDDPTWASH